MDGTLQELRCVHERRQSGSGLVDRRRQERQAGQATSRHTVAAAAAAAGPHSRSNRIAWPDHTCRTLCPRSAAAPAGASPAAAAAPLSPRGQPGGLPGAPAGGTGGAWQHPRLPGTLHFLAFGHFHAKVASHACPLPLSGGSCWFGWRRCCHALQMCSSCSVCVCFPCYTTQPLLEFGPCSFVPAYCKPTAHDATHRRHSCLAMHPACKHL